MTSCLSDFNVLPFQDVPATPDPTDWGINFGAFIVIFGVIARLHRATQYSGAFVI
jgi:hypothetical protein